MNADVYVGVDDNVDVDMRMYFDVDVGGDVYDCGCGYVC